MPKACYRFTLGLCAFNHEGQTMRLLLSLAVMALLAIPSAVMAMPLGPSQASSIVQPESAVIEVKHGGHHSSGGSQGGRKYYSGKNYSGKNYSNRNYSGKHYSNKHYSGKRYHGRPDYRYPPRHHPRYIAGRNYHSAPYGWRRYGYRPDNWSYRGCILVGPYWFCP